MLRRNRNRLLAAVTSSVACLAIAVGLQAPTAYAAVSLTVLSDNSVPPAHPGDHVFVGVTVETDDTPTSGLVYVHLKAVHGLVLRVDNLGYNVDCHSTASGRGECVSEAPLSAFHVFELSVEVLIGSKGKVAKLISTAESPADNVSGSDTTTIPIAG
jgi:hypothetical protein